MELRKWYDGPERLAGLKHGERRISFDVSITERAPTRSYPVPGVWDFRWGTLQKRCERQSPSRILKDHSVSSANSSTGSSPPLLSAFEKSATGMGAMSTTIGQSFSFGSVSQIVGIVRVVC